VDGKTKEVVVAVAAVVVEAIFAEYILVKTRL
jgi:hypothetical protein